MKTTSALRKNLRHYFSKMPDGKWAGGLDSDINDLLDDLDELETQRDEALARADKLSHACDTHDNRAHKFEKENAALRAELARKTEALEYVASGNPHCLTCAAKHAKHALADSPKADK